MRDVPDDTLPLVRRIREAISACAPFDGKVRVSVADEPRWETTSSGDQVLVRWACWTLERNGVELTEPVFEVLCKDITRESLADDLSSRLPDVEIEVDNAIEV
ncbi:hypothetical protein [Polyangium mundeleinium]|uniref:Uncharacterized protein n=1 Tax=Polyangium mundeleinium TaxID=2995306 RepID=A0ABT5ELU5_9BACT|nr:hypothetical protein [Polyangium mundeleinium]MDC0742815.1 hypothetical protein [Polyangium mundeleinium]